MKTINVVAAIIIHENKVLATQRGYGEFLGLWEFPGGKVEESESKELALVREIEEELEAKIDVKEWLHRIEYDYPNFHLSMDCYICHLTSKHLHLLEHQDARWLTKETLYSVNWIPADIEILDKILSYLS